MNVRDIMTADVPLVSPEHVVADVVRIMLDRNLPALPVVDASNGLVGLVRAHDLVARHARVHVPFYLGLLGAAIPFQSSHEDEEIRHALAVTAGDLMTSKIRTVAPDDSIDDDTGRQLAPSQNVISYRDLSGYPALSDSFVYAFIVPAEYDEV